MRAAIFIAFLLLPTLADHRAQAADLDQTYVGPHGETRTIVRRYRHHLPPQPPEVYSANQANPQDLRFYPRAPFVQQPFLIDPYAPSIFGAPLSPPTYGYGY